MSNKEQAFDEGVAFARKQWEAERARLIEALKAMVELHTDELMYIATCLFNSKESKQAQSLLAELAESDKE